MKKKSSFEYKFRTNGEIIHDSIILTNEERKKLVELIKQIDIKELQDYSANNYFGFSRQIVIEFKLKNIWIAYPICISDLKSNHQKPLLELYFLLLNNKEYQEEYEYYEMKAINQRQQDSLILATNTHWQLKSEFYRNATF